MSVSCKIIKDLLPLYYDNVCSEESRDLVSEHISDCISCQEELRKFETDFVCNRLKTDEVEPIRKISLRWKKDIIKAFLKGTLITVIIGVLLFVGLWGLTQWNIIPVSPDLLKVSDVSQLSDGRIVYHLYVTDDRDLYFVKFSITKDGSYYQTPYRAVIAGKRAMENGLYNDYYVIDVAECNAQQQTDGVGVEITACYVGPKDNAILIWKKGMKLPNASKELEEKFVQNNYDVFHY